MFSAGFVISQVRLLVTLQSCHLFCKFLAILVLNSDNLFVAQAKGDCRVLQRYHIDLASSSMSPSYNLARCDQSLYLPFPHLLLRQINNRVPEFIRLALVHIRTCYHLFSLKSVTVTCDETITSETHPEENHTLLPLAKDNHPGDSKRERRRG
jgi:hypothetical protein